MDILMVVVDKVGSTNLDVNPGMQRQNKSIPSLIMVHKTGMVTQFITKQMQ